VIPLAESHREVDQNEPGIWRWMMRRFPERFATSAYRLADRASRRAGEDMDQLFERAQNRFRSLHRANPTYVPALKLWGVALAGRALKCNQPIVDQMYGEAVEKLSLALTLAPNDVEVLINLAKVLERLAWLKLPHISRPGLVRARELAERALSLEPHHPQALDVWAFVLYGQVHAVPGEDIDQTLADAYAKFKSAYESTANGGILSGWATIAFAQADRTSGSDADRLLRDAKGKYAEAYSRDPMSTYNLACVCARLGELDECRDWLEKSGEPGRFLTREEMAADPELAAVRNCAWFQLLLGA